VVESQPSKLLVAGSIPVSRSNLRSLRELRLARQGRRVHRSAQRGGGLAGQVSRIGCSDIWAGRRVGRSAKDRAASAKADVAQLAERVLGKDEVTSSILVIGSNFRSRLDRARRASVGEPAFVPRRLGQAGCPP
jgi:hypothetical protein